jgi:hypothetical protein
MMRVYNIDDDTAFNEFVEFMKLEKPEKTFEDNIITLPEFKVKIFPEYQEKLNKLFESERKSFNIDGQIIEVIENQGYKFITFKG